MPQPVEEVTHRVGTGEGDPGEVRQARDGRVDGSPVVGRGDLQQWQGMDLGPLGLQQQPQRTGLLPAAGDENPPAEEGFALEPVQGLTQVDDLADDDQCR